MALCSLAMVGNSINKGLLRNIGLFMAGAAIILLQRCFRRTARNNM